MAHVKITMNMILETPILDVLYLAFDEVRFLHSVPEEKYRVYEVRGRGLPDDVNVGVQLHFGQGNFNGIISLVGWTLNHPEWERKDGSWILDNELREFEEIFLYNIHERTRV